MYSLSRFTKTFWVGSLAFAGVVALASPAAVEVKTRPEGGLGSRLSGLLSSGEFEAKDLDEIWSQRKRLHGSLAGFAASNPQINDDYEVLYRVSQLLAYVGTYVLQKAPEAKRAEAFALGYQIANRAREKEPSRVEGHYWYAINRSGFALTDGPWHVWETAPDVLAALDQAVAILPAYFFSGPYRARGRLLMKMPPWPLSIGDRSKALSDLRAAVDLNPDTRLNQLYLAEALLLDGKRDEAHAIVSRYRELGELMGSVEEATIDQSFIDLERKLNP